MARLLNKSHDDLEISSHEEGRQERRGLWIWLGIVALVAALIVIGCLYTFKWIMLIGMYVGIGLVAGIIGLIAWGALCTGRFINNYDKDEEEQAKKSEGTK